MEKSSPCADVLLFGLRKQKGDPQANKNLTKFSGLFSVEEVSLEEMRRGAPRSQRGLMSLDVFVAVCVVGMDFLIFALFQWTYGERRQTTAKKLAAQRTAMKADKARPFVVVSRKCGPVTQARLQRVRARMAGVA
jgi:hypothetical protein